MIGPRLSRRTVFISVASAIALHAALAAVLVWTGVIRFSTIEPATQTVRGEHVEITAEVSGGKVEQVESNQLAEQLDRGLAEYQKLSPSQLDSRLREKTLWLEKHSSEESVANIGELLRSATGARTDRAYEPAATPPPGTFGFNDSLIYGVRRETDEHGRSQAFYILLDAQGRTMEVPVPPEQDRTARMIERMHSSPLLQQLWQQTILPLMDAQLSRQRGSAGGAAGGEAQ